MKFFDRTERAAKILLLVACGATLPGGGCVSDIRDNMVKGGLGFVNSYTQSLINALVPNVDELFPGIPPTPPQ